MSSRATTRGRPPLSARQHAERAHRILDAAERLVLRRGYGKTTIADVAHAAGVAKGTIYLHWKSREDLFATLMRRDRSDMAGQVRRHLHADPDASLPRLFAELVRELGRRPLLRAAVVQDADVLGRLVERKRAGGSSTALVEPLGAYLSALRTCGAVRSDLSTPELLTVISSLLYGSLTSATMLPEAARVPDDRCADLLGDTVARFVDPGGRSSPTTRATAAAATREYIDCAHATVRATFQKSLESGLPTTERSPA